ncbi:helix-turn-helix domain-containing protein [Yinghuangia seranimata]|uniref:helix-turn-helix domain-containing protein n=1 Tax=Yinghuangia seranimata TaxID=408067 RepID=UPI00248AF0D5|nr:helix-turn-helix transcriptional regulator [Yinghuangia seranimata]MDI2126022.1 helix-turn-helix transcriptional regulator [Yinghuangia seranimata]
MAVVERVGGEQVTDDDTYSTADFFHAIGRQIKVLRERAGFSQKELASRVGYSEEQISSIEIGRRTPQPDLLEVLDELLDAGGLLKTVIPDVVKAKERPRVRHPDWFKDYAELEAKAVELCEFSTLAIPGQMQTEAYARAVFTNRRPILDEETVEMRVQARLARQEMFSKWPPVLLSVVLWEPVLRQPIGGREVQREQLQRLLELGSLRSVEIQVLPSSCEAHAGMNGPFTLLTVQGRSQMAYFEVQHLNRLITNTEEVRVVAAKYGSLRAEALTRRESAGLIKRLLGEL